MIKDDPDLLSVEKQQHALTEARDPELQFSPEHVQHVENCIERACLMDRLKATCDGDDSDLDLEQLERALTDARALTVPVPEQWLSAVELRYDRVQLWRRNVELLRKQKQQRQDELLQVLGEQLEDAQQSTEERSLPE